MKKFVSVGISLAGLTAFTLLGTGQGFASSQSPVATVHSQSPWTQDKSSEDPSLARFLKELNQVVQHRDATRLLTMVANDMRSSFGVDHGKPTFIDMWHLNANPKGSPLWRQLHDLLVLGGDFTSTDHSTYMFPYLFSHFPAGYSQEEYALVVGSGVNVHVKPDIHSKCIVTVSYAVVRPMSPPTGQSVTIEGYSYKFIEVTTAKSSVHGYICEKYVRSPLGLRMGLRKSATGKWNINLLVSGD